MLPFTSSHRSSSNYGGEYNFPDFIRRMFDFRQMDFESAFDQIFSLLSFEPQRVYTSFYHRKRKYLNYLSDFSTKLLFCNVFLVKTSETKNQWARDDPAFVVIQLCFLMV